MQSPANKKNVRTCSKGHRYYKSSDCPVCPVCEKERLKEESFLSMLSAPARRALERQGITTLNALSNYRVEEILKFHGMGPASIPKLQAALVAEGLAFKE